MNLKANLIYVVLFLSFDLHVFVAAIAGNNYIFDEAYYVPSSVDTLRGLASNIEHPPLVKAIIGGFIGVFGDNWFSWRIPIILFAVLATYFTYLIGKKFLSERTSVFAAGLMSLSIIFFLLGSTAMLDVPCIALGLAGLYFALRGNFGTSGLMFGLSFLCKELAVIMFAVTWIYLIIKKTNRWRQLFFVGVAFAVAFGGMWIYDIVFQPKTATETLVNPIEHFILMVVYQLKLNGLRGPTSDKWYPPLAWVSPFGANAWNPLRWIWLQVGGKMIYAWLAQPSPAVEYLTFPLLALLPVAWWIRRNSFALLCWLWIGFNYLPWFIVGFFVRTEANFYISFSVPFLALGSAYLYSFIRNRKLKYGLAATQIIVGVVWFLIYFPIPLLR
jgi:4-amino-4-deoxy-L-arabinose transferase-like glycosyltransferase